MHQAVGQQQHPRHNPDGDHHPPHPLRVFAQPPAAPGNDRRAGHDGGDIEPVLQVIPAPGQHRQRRWAGRYPRYACEPCRQVGTFHIVFAGRLRVHPPARRRARVKRAGRSGSPPGWCRLWIRPANTVSLVAHIRGHVHIAAPIERVFDKADLAALRRARSGAPRAGLSLGKAQRAEPGQGRS